MRPFPLSYRAIASFILVAGMGGMGSEARATDEPAGAASGEQASGSGAESKQRRRYFGRLFPRRLPEAGDRPTDLGSKPADAAPAQGVNPARSSERVAGGSSADSRPGIAAASAPRKDPAIALTQAVNPAPSSARDIGDASAASGASVGATSAARKDPALSLTQGVNQNQTSYLNTGDVAAGSQADQGFGARLFDAYFGPLDPPEPEDPAHPSRRGYPAPFQAPPMPFSDFIGPTIGVNDTSVFPLMDALYKGRNGQAWKDSRFKIYGWFDPSYNASTSKNSNIPLTYSIVPNKLELSQTILIFERVLDTAQTEHVDWGFRFTNLYGIDFRYTAAKGYFSDQLLKHNHLYGYDPLQMQLDLYFPNVGQGMILRMGRYISPLDIEAQLSPENFLYTHSNMYSVDPYTFTGVQSTTKLNDQVHLTVGMHAGADMAPWTTSSQPNGEILLKWVSKDNKDSLYGGLDSIGHGYFKNGHDDLQIFGFTWSHKFNDRFTTMTEQYYLWERGALSGGTVTNGNPEPYFLGVGPGKPIRGLSNAYGIVNYTSYVLNSKSLIVFRSDCLADFQGWRTGYAGADFEHTLGYVRHVTPWAILRPEVRFDYTSGQKSYDNGTRRSQFTFSCDLIIKF